MRDLLFSGDSVSGGDDGRFGSFDRFLIEMIDCLIELRDFVMELIYLIRGGGEGGKFGRFDRCFNRDDRFLIELRDF